MKLPVPLLRTLGASLVALSFSACSGNETPDSLLSKAQDSIRASDPRSAEIHLKNLLQQEETNAEARFLLGEIHRQSNDLRFAEKELRRARDLGYDPKQVQPALFETMLALGDAQEVADEAKDISTGDALADARIRTAVGRAQLQLGKNDEARKAFEAALAAKSDHTPAKVSLALLQAGTDRPGARAAVEQILKDEPDSTDALSLKADLDIADRHFDAARKSLTQLIEQRPNDVASRAKLASIALELNDLEAAERETTHLRRLAPRSPITHYLTALVHSRKNNLNAAREEVQEALRLAPDYLPAVGLAAGLSLSANALESAEQFSRQLIERLPQNPVGFRVLGATLLKRNEPQRALDAVHPGLQRHPEDATLLAIAGEAALKLNQAKEAAGYFQRASSLSPDNARSRTGLALSHIASGDTSTGIEELEEAIELDAGNLQADVALITTLMRNREFDKALEAVDRLEKKAPPASALPSNLRGSVLAARGDLAGARAAFEKAAQTDPKFFAAAANLATLDLRDGRPGDARQRYETLLAADPKNPQAGVALAVLTARTGGTRDEVLGQLKRAREANPDAVLPILATARYLMQTNKPKDAIPMLQEASNRNATDVRILDQLALAFRQSEQPTQAIATWEKLLRVNPKAALAQFRIGETQLAGGDRDAALASFRKATEIAPDAVEPKVAAASVLLQQGRADDALRIGTQMAANEKTKVAGLMLEGDVQAASGKLPEAITKYRAAFAEQPTLPVGSKLHRALLAGKQEAQADKMLRDWIRTQPADLNLRMFAGESQTARKQWKEAFEQYAVVLEQQPKNAIALNNSAWALHELKDERAVDYGRRAYEAAPKSAAVIDTYGTILVAKGDRKGVELLREAVSLAPTSAQLRLHLAEALVKFDDKPGARSELETLLKTTPEGTVAESAKALLAKLD